MGTTAGIFIKLRPEDVGKIMKFDINKLPYGIKSDYLAKEIPKEIKLEGSIAGTFCLFDGHTDGVGKVLCNKFDTYDKVLNLILCGSFAQLLEELIVPKRMYRNVDTEIIFSNSLDVVENCEFDCAYLYEDGEWKEFNSDPVKGYYNLRKLLDRMEYQKARDIMLKVFLFKGIDTNGNGHTAIVAARNKKEAYETLKSTSTITPFPYSNKAIYVDEFFCHRLYADLIHED